MTLDDYKAGIPDYAKDVKLNLSKALTQFEHLSESQTIGTALAIAYATKVPKLITLLEELAATALDDNYRQAAKIAASLMAMNNIYYRFVHLSSDTSFAQLPAGLRMQAIGNPGIDKADFELFSLAVSALNGCGMCIDAHIKALYEHGISKEQIQAAIRIAAILNSAAMVDVIER